MSIERTDGAGEVCEQLGVTEQTLRRYCTEGCPHTKGGPGKANTYDVAEVFAWMREQNRTGRVGRPREQLSPELEAAKLRKENAMARNWEIRNAVGEGRLIDLNAVTQRFGNAGASLRSSLESMGEQIAHLVVGKTATEAATIIDNETSRRVDAALDVQFK